MRLTTSLATASIALGALAALTACGSGDDHAATVPLTAAASPSASASVSQTPSAAVDPDAIAASHPEIGLAFDDLPEATGARQVALETWTDFEVASRRSMTSLQLDPAVARLGGEGPATGIRNSIDYLNGKHQRQAGTLHERFIRFVGSNDDLVVFDACYDGRQAWREAADGSGKREALDPAVTAVRVQVTNIAGAWKVSDMERRDGTC